MENLPAKPSIEAVLAHHGVRGMRWGKRKRQDTGEKKSHKKAIALTVAGGYALLRLAPVIKKYTMMTLTSAVARKTAANGARAAANLLADSRGIANYKTINLVFDAASSTFR